MFFFNDTATTEIYTLSLHDALPILVPGDTACGKPDSRASTARQRAPGPLAGSWTQHSPRPTVMTAEPRDRKSTRLNSSHANISYAVFCLKKNKFRPTRHRRGAITWR